MAPNGVDRIVYVGAGNGTLYAINAATGTRRWSFNTTRTANPVLRDRNDLNASPALTNTGVVIGGEDGYVKYVPYDYCLHVRDSRCDTDPGQAFPANMTRLYTVTAGGNTQLAGGTGSVGSSTVLPIRLVATHNGSTLDAAMHPLPNANSLVHTSPAFPFHAETSGDGHYLFVVPDGFLNPGTNYSVRLKGLYTANGAGVGDIRLGASTAGSFDQTIPYKIAPSTRRVPFTMTPRKVSAMSMTRLSFPLPAFLTSVNQIGFDAYDLIVGVLSMTKPDASGGGSLLLWAIGARPGPGGVEQADPATTLGFALAGRYQGNSISLSATNPTLTFSFGPVPVQTLDLRAQLSPNFTAMPGADIYGEVTCASVPTYGPLLPTQRLCNNEGKLIANGTFLTGSYSRKGTTNLRPRGLSLASLSYAAPSATAAGSLVANLAVARRATYPASSHVISLVLTDASTGAPVGINYRADTTTATDGRGNISKVTLAIPAGTQMPASVRAYVVSDVFPLASRVLP
jgi:hypothetical protein